MDTNSNLIFNGILEGHTRVRDSGLEDNAVVTVVLLPPSPEDSAPQKKVSDFFGGFNRRGDARVPTFIIVLGCHAFAVLTLEQMLVGCLSGSALGHWCWNLARCLVIAMAIVFSVACTFCPTRLLQSNL